MLVFVKEHIESYKCISSQVAQQTIITVDEAYKSFFESIKVGLKSARPPNYLKESLFNLAFQTQSFQVIGDSLRLSLGNSSLCNRQFLFFKLNQKLLSGKDITEVEIVPSRYDSLPSIPSSQSP